MIETYMEVHKITDWKSFTDYTTEFVNRRWLTKQERYELRAQGYEIRSINAQDKQDMLRQYRNTSRKRKG